MTKTKKRKPDPMNEAFPITSLCREDLRNPMIGFSKRKARNVSDEQMARIASKLADDYCEQLFWNSLRIIADIIINEE